MSEEKTKTTINYGWLKDYNGNKFLPTTLYDQILTKEGASLPSYIDGRFTAINTELNKVRDTERTLEFTGDAEGDVKFDLKSENKKLSVILELTDTGVLTGIKDEDGNQVTSKSFGIEANTTPDFGTGTFKVPSFTVGSDGRLIAATAYTVTMPSIKGIENSISNLQNAHKAIKVELNGDISGEADIITEGDNANKVIITTNIMDIEGLTSGNYGDNTDEEETTKQLSFEGEFKVPQIEVQSDGRVAKISDYTLKLPSVQTIENALNKKINITFTTDGDVTGKIEKIGLGDTQSVTLELSNTNVTAGSYGINSDANLDNNATIELKHEDKFTVPNFTVDEDGRLTDAGNKILQLPSISGLEKTVGDIDYRTKCIDASDNPQDTKDNRALYVVDGQTPANIIMKIDETGATCCNFTVVPDAKNNYGDEYNNFISLAELVHTLYGDASVPNSVAYKIAQIVNDNDSTSINTLQEIADWINNHPQNAAQLNSMILANAEAHNSITIKLSGDVSGEGKIITDGNNKNQIWVTTDITSCITTPAGNGYGNNTNLSDNEGKTAKQLSFESEFKVPYFKVQSDGRITEALDYILKLPSIEGIENSIIANTNAIANKTQVQIITWEADD